MLRKVEILPILLIFSGVAIFSWMFLLPIIEAKASLDDGGVGVLSPSVSDLGGSLLRNFDLPSLPFSTLLSEGKKPADFYLTIERLGIKRARIIANLDTAEPSIYLRELLQGVGHLRGSSFPGEGGTVFLFGHSSLPFLFNSGDYSTIFSSLNKLKKGKRIVVEFAGRNFFYRVESLKTVSANARVSEFDSNSEKLIILTCFPPGLLTERLVVTALPVN